jgi:hypothetical protein
MFLPLHPGLNRGCPSFFISRRLVTTRDAKEPVRLLRSVATGPAQSPVALAASAESRRQSTAYGRLRLLDSQVAQQPVERLLVGVVLLPAGEVADVSEKRPEPGHGQRQRMAPPPWRSRAGPEAYAITRKHAQPAGTGEHSASEAISAGVGVERSGRYGTDQCC